MLAIVVLTDVKQILAKCPIFVVNASPSEAMNALKKSLNLQLARVKSTMADTKQNAVTT